MADGRVVIDVILDDGTVAKGVANIDGKFKGLGEAAKRSAASVGNIVKALGLVAIASKAIDMVKNSLDGAISRYDTLNNFPRVLQLMGFDAKESQAAIDKLADGIEGLPTTLDSVAKTTQRIALMTGDLEGATDTTLALNNAFLASGASAADAERGLEQYVQMLSKGEVDLQSWRTLQETMPIALNETAKAFGFTGKSAQNDLYEALKEGDITFDQFNSKIVELSNKTGGFADIARESSGGIKTAWTNIKTAIAKGVADVIGAVDEALGGVGSIEGMLDKVKAGIKAVFKWIVEVIPKVAEVFRNVRDKIVDTIQAIKDKFEEWKPVIDGVIKAFEPFVDTLKNSVKNLHDSIQPIWESLKTLFDSLRPILELIAGIVLAVVIPAWGLMSAIWSGVVSALGPVIEAFINLADFIVNSINFVIAVLTGDFSGAMDYWTALTESSIDFFKNLWDGVVSFFKGFIDTIVGFFEGLYMTLVGNSIIPDMVNAIIKWFGNLGTWAKEKVISMITAVIKFFTDLKAKAVEKIASMVSTVVTKFTEMKTKAVNKAIEIYNNVRDKFNQIKQAISNKISEAKTALVNKFSEMVSNARTKAAEIVSTARTKFQEVKQAIQNKLAEAVQVVARKVGEMPGKVRAKAGEMLSAGRQLVQGLINGIKNMGQSAISAITGVVNGVVNKAKSLLKIKSPSRLFMGFGEYLSEGLAIGINKMSGMAEKASQRLAEGVSGSIEAEIKPNVSGLNRLRGVTAPLGNVMPISAAVKTAAQAQPTQNNADAATLAKDALSKRSATIVIQSNGRQWARAHIDDLSTLLQDKVINASIMGRG